MSSNGKLGTSAQAVPTNWSALDFGAATEAGIYSYTRLNEFLPFATIACEPDRSPLQEEIDSGLFHKILQTPFGPQTIEALFANPSGAPRGAIILHRGSIVLEHYGDISQYDRHIWMSTAKTWIGLLFSRLQDAGLVDCDATIGSVLKEAIGTAWANIRIRDALNMSTGLDVEETLAAQTDPTTSIAQFFLAEFGQNAPDGTSFDYRSVLFGAQAIEAPGTEVRYSSMVTNMLGLAAEEIADRSLTDMMEDIWQDMGAQRDALICLTPSGDPIIHGLMLSTLRDLGRYAALYTPSWQNVTDTPIVPEGYLVALSHEPAIAGYAGSDLGQRMTQVFGECPRCNAWQWDAVFEDGDIFKSGLNGQGLYVSPTADMAVCWFGASQAGVAMHPLARALAKSFREDRDE